MEEKRQKEIVHFVCQSKNMIFLYDFITHTKKSSLTIVIFLKKKVNTIFSRTHYEIVYFHENLVALLKIFTSLLPYHTQRSNCFRSLSLSLSISYLIFVCTCNHSRSTEFFFFSFFYFEFNKYFIYSNSSSFPLINSIIFSISSH